MIGTKEGKFLKFTLDDGKVVKYDLSTGQSIGTKNNVVNNVGYKFRNIPIDDILNSIENKEYADFLKFVYKKEYRVKSFGTLLTKVKRYNRYEQIFSSKVKVGNLFCSPSLVTPNIIKFCKNNDLEISNSLCINYQKNTNFCNLLFAVNCVTFSNKEKQNLLNSTYLFNNILELIEHNNYNQKSIIRYIDDIMTYEALSLTDVVINLSDYVNMMSGISNKYDKYPRNLLTSHQIAVRNYNRLKEIYNEEKFKKTVDESFEWRYKDYIVVIPKCTQDIKDEAVQQNNCVASYIDEVIQEKCRIVFLRKRESPEKSLVTVELIDSKVV